MRTARSYARPLSTQSRRVIVLLLTLGAFFCLEVPDVSAQQRDKSLESMLAEADLDGRAADRSAIEESTVSEVNRRVQWQLFKRVAADGQAGIDELAALESDGRSLGYINQPAKAMAVAELANHQKDVDVGHKMFRSAKYLAPDLPYVHFAHARFAFERDPGAFHHWAVSYLDGMSRAFQWPDTSIPWALKLVAFFALAFFVSGLFFAVGQTIRQTSIVTYDAARFMPAGFSSNQTVVLLLALIVVPGLLLRSPMISLFILLALLSITQRLRERLVTLLVFAGFALLPQLDHLLEDLAAYSGSTTQVLAQAQYVHCGPICRDELDARQSLQPDDKHVLYTRLLVAYRSGQQDQLERVIEEVSSTEWPIELKGYALNLQGAALLARGKPDEALEILGRARALLTQSAAPLLNLMRAYHMLDELDKAANMLEEASSRNVHEVAEYLRYDRRDVNSFLVAARLPLDSFFSYHQTIERESRSVIAPIWGVLAGEEIPLDKAPLLGFIGILIALLGLVPQTRSKLSTPCPRCGLARDPEDTSSTGNHAYCMPCYRTFVTGAGLDYHARVYNETVLGRREKIQEGLRRGLSVVLPGVGHHVAGRALTGAFVTFALVSGAMLYAMPLGIVRPMHELGSDNWGGPQALGLSLVFIAVLIVLVAAARDIAPLREGGKR